MGRKVMTEVMDSPQKSLDVSRLPKGMYILNIKNGREVETMKFTKE